MARAIAKLAIEYERQAAPHVDMRAIWVRKFILALAGSELMSELRSCGLDERKTLSRW